MGNISLDIKLKEKELDKAWEKIHELDLKKILDTLFSIYHDYDISRVSFEIDKFRDGTLGWRMALNEGKIVLTDYKSKKQKQHE